MTTPRQLLVEFTRMAIAATLENRDHHPAPAKGPRGLKRAARKRRRERHVATLRRNAWRSYFESLKKEAA